MVRMRHFIPLLFLAALSSGTGTAAAAAAENPVKVSVSTAYGFDDNAGLSSARQSDSFAQESATVRYKKLLNAKSQLRLGYSALNVNYFDATDQNILSQQASAGLNVILAPEWMWENEYTFQHLDFTRNEAVTQYSNGLRTGLLRKLSKRASAGAGFTVAGTQYENKKTRSGDGLFSADDERTDGRWGLDAKFNYKLHPKLLMNLGGMAYWNDSDDQFHDYYDYASYKLLGGLSWLMSERWISFWRLSYERREYDSRPLKNNADKQQSDDAMTAGVSVFYKVDKNLSVGSTYTYRQKWSDEPSQEYSGALGTLGLYYNF